MKFTIVRSEMKIGCSSRGKKTIENKKDQIPPPPPPPPILFLKSSLVNQDIVEQQEDVKKVCKQTN